MNFTAQRGIKITPQLNNCHPQMLLSPIETIGDGYGPPTESIGGRFPLKSCGNDNLNKPSNDSIGGKRGIFR